VASQSVQTQQPARQRGLLVIYAALMVAVLLAALDQTIVATALLARQANVTTDYGRPYVDRLVSEGMVVRSNGTLVLTDSGHEAADRLFAARREGLRELLADWSPEEYAELGELLTKLSRALLGEDADQHLIDAEPTAATPAADS